MRVFFFVLIPLLGIGGCAATQPDRTLGPPSDFTTPSPEEIDEALALISRRATDSLLVDELRTGGLTPIVADRFRLYSGAIAAFIPGRHPLRKNELVIAVAQQGKPEAAVLMAVARLFVMRAERQGTSPERTIVVAFLPSGSVSARLADVVKAPLWSSSAKAGLVSIGSETVRDAAGEYATTLGIPVQLVRTNQGDRLAEAEARSLVMQGYDAIRTLADNE